MAKYIDLDLALAVIEGMQRELCPAGRFGPSYVYGTDRETFYAWQNVADLIESIPAAGVAPVVHGRWEYCKNLGIAVCNECGFERELDANFGRAISCPNCGAKMDKEAP